MLRVRCTSFLVFLAFLLSGVRFLPARPAAAQDQASELINLINDLRASSGLAPYTVDPGLMAMAQEHSEYQASIHKSTHQHSNGLGPRELGVVENVAGGTYGYVTPYNVVYDIWVDAGHRFTLVGYPAGAMGVGVADDGITTYYTLELRPSGAPLSSPPVGGNPPTSGTSATSSVQSPAGTPIPFVPLATTTPRPDGSIVHVVGYGQTLWAIALAYGVTVDQLRAWNNIPADSSAIYAGQKLLVRPPGLAPASSSPTSTYPPTLDAAGAGTPNATLQPTLVKTHSPTPLASSLETPTPLVENPNQIEQPPAASAWDTLTAGFLKSLPYLGGISLLVGLALLLLYKKSK